MVTIMVEQKLEGGIGKMKKVIIGALFVLMALLTVYGASADLVVSPASLEFKGDYNDTVTRSVVVRNTGNTTLTGLYFSETGLSEFAFTYSANNFDLAAGANRSVDISTTIPDMQNPAVYNGVIEIKNSLDSASLAVKVDLTDVTGLVISDLEIDGDDVAPGETKGKVKPLEEVTFEVTVTNNLPDRDDEITDIEVAVTINNIDDGGEEDIDLTSDDFDLEGNGDDYTAQLSFVVPYDVEHETEYRVDIEVTGEGPDNEDYSVEWTVYIEVKKEKDLLRIMNYEISPESLTCDYRYAEIKATVVDIGSNDQDETVLKIKNSLLGIDQRYQFEIDSDPDKDNFEVIKSYSFNVDEDTAPGTYTIDLYLYFDMEKQIDHRTLQLVVPDCNPTTTTTPDSGTSGSGTALGPGGISPGLSYSSESEGFAGGSGTLYTALLAVLILLAVTGIVFLSVKLFRSF
jgi:hypothetical protein